MSKIPEGFTPWDGGNCPVEAKGRMTEVIFRDGSNEILDGASLRWTHYSPAQGWYDHDIIAYRVKQTEAKAGSVFYGGQVAFNEKESGPWCAYVWGHGPEHPLAIVHGDTPLDAVSAANNLAQRLTASSAQEPLTTCPDGCVAGMICAACDKDRSGAKFADIDAEALRVARLFTINDNPQGRARMQCRIIAAINGDFGSLVDLTSYDESDHGTASVLLAESLGLELPCTLAEMVGEIRRLQEQKPKPAEGGAVDEPTADDFRSREHLFPLGLKLGAAAKFITVHSPKGERPGWGWEAEYSQGKGYGYGSRAEAALSAVREAFRVYQNPIAPSAATRAEADAVAAMSRMKDRAMEAHRICYEAMLRHPNVPELGDDGELHKAIHAIVGVDTPQYVERAEEVEALHPSTLKWLAEEISFEHGQGEGSELGLTGDQRRLIHLERLQRFARRLAGKGG